MVHPRGYNKKVDRPTSTALSKAFADLGTQKEVARHYDVSRATVWKWQNQFGLNIDYRPEIPRAKKVIERFSRLEDRVRVAQWLCDEGTISTTYDYKGDNTFLAVSGGMVDSQVLGEIGRVVGERVNNRTKTPTLGWLPMRYVRLNSAEAFALLQAIQDELLGLKRLEAKAALAYFPPCGYVRGRHSTDEFMQRAWRQYGKEVSKHGMKQGNVRFLGLKQ